MLDTRRHRIAAERRPQRGGRQRQVIALAERRHQTHLARRAIGIGLHVEESATLRSLLEDRQIRAIARRRRHARVQRVERRDRQGRRRQHAGMGVAVARRNEVIAERNRTFGKCPGKARVIIEVRGEVIERGPERAVGREIVLRQLFERSETRTRIRFGEHHVEPDRRHAVAVEQLFDERGHFVAAPRPASDAFQAGFVDVEDGHAIVRSRRRGMFQPGVIQPGLGTLHGRDMDQSAHMRRDQQDEQRGQPRLRQPGRDAYHRIR